MRKTYLIGLISLAVLIVFFASFMSVSAAPKCKSNCTTLGATKCLGNYKIACGKVNATACYKWSNASYCAYGCSNNKCKAKPAAKLPIATRFKFTGKAVSNLTRMNVTKPTCLAGWKCQSSKYKGYQYSTCSWSNVGYCLKGCVNGGVCKK